MDPFWLIAVWKWNQTSIFDWYDMLLNFWESGEPVQYRPSPIPINLTLLLSDTCHKKGAGIHHEVEILH